jgi:hypothetical protein
MSAAVVEVKDHDTFAFYKAYIKDFQNGRVLVHYEHGWKPDQWIECGDVRQSVPPHNPQLFDPRVGDSVEALAKSHEDEPFSWWRARVKTIKGEFFLINYSDWDDTYNEIVEKEMLRPPNPNPCLAASELCKKELDIPVELRQTEEERKDPMVQKQKQHEAAEMQQQSGVLTLLEDPVRQKLVILGHTKAVERAALLANLHFKHQKQLRTLHANKQKAVQVLEESKQRLQNGYIEEFSVDKSLVALVIGKKGANIAKAEKSPGVDSIRVQSETGQITVVAKDKESALGARKMLEFVQETFNVPRSQIGRFVGAGYTHIRQIEKDSGTTRIRVPQSDRDRNSQPQQQETGDSKGARGGRNAGRRDNNNNRRNPRSATEYESDDPVGIEIIGSREAVQNAIMLMQHHLKYIMEALAIAEEQRHVNDQLYQLSVAYGIKPGSRNNRNTESTDGEQTNGQGQQRRRGGRPRRQDDADGGAEAKDDAKEKETAADDENNKQRRKNKEEKKARRAKEKTEAAPENAEAAQSASEPAAPTPAEEKPKRRAPRKPANRTDVAEATNDQQ